MSTPLSEPRLRLTRRGFVVGAFALGGAGWAFWPGVQEAGTISAADALRSAEAGEIKLIDIRRPDEWIRTGIGRGAIPIDMRQRDFEQKLFSALGGDRTKPIALICARGVRSRRLAVQLLAAGFTDIVDVSEGMEGSSAGLGWVQRGLPRVRR